MSYQNQLYANFSKPSATLDWRTFVTAGYTVPPRNTNSLARAFQKENVFVDPQSQALILRVKGGSTTDGKVECAGIFTKIKTICYGSFRCVLKAPPSNAGTVVGFFFYGDDKHEIDIELLTHRKANTIVNCTVHEIERDERGRAKECSHREVDVGFDLSEDFHEYRFDWTQDAVTFYVDSTEICQLHTNIPQQPGCVTLNHWSSGDVGFSKGPPECDVDLKVKEIDLRCFNLK
ncbi:hypothetical protein K7432_014075 [Basidiobolus ranarum]|uniref:GH16 domain-containing protein n=1 Tax=Basidiobolus ranarum TaxID=34480 RepID=A0ABR2WIB4_9FUNG